MFSAAFPSPFSTLRTALLSLLLLSFGGAAQARPRPHYAVPGGEKPVALLHAGHATYLVTAHSVFRLEGREFMRRQQLSSPIQCAALAADTALWVGTRAGLQSVNTASFKTHALRLPGSDAAPGITAVFRDARGAMWVGANGQGVFRWANNAFTQELHTPAINGGVATADSSVWIATSIGLSRKQGPEWTRYNEEGVANHEIPDNIVEKLLPDNAGNLWVIMSDAICVFEHGGQRGAAEEELPTVKFIGRPGNEVTGVAALPGTGRLFATTQGLLLLPNESAGFASFAPTTDDKVVPKQLLMPLTLPPGTGNPVLLEVDKQQRLWLAGTEGVTVLNSNELHHFIQTNNPAKTDSKGMAQLGAGH
jgi:ligand-binding sensor domain-containing protein